MTLDDVGKFIGCHQDGVNFQAKILKIEIFEDGHAPGVGLVLQCPPLPKRAATRDAWRVPFDEVLELVELIAM